MDKSAPSLPKPKVVLGVAAHPDDLDYYAGGTMALFAKQGADIYYLVLTDGSKGSDDRTMTPQRLRDIRHQEQQQAATLLGVKQVFFADFPDAELQNSMPVKQEIVKCIRQVKPDVLVTLDPTVLYDAKLGFVNHTDHRVAGQATLDAVFPLARDHMALPELLSAGYEPHKVKTLLLATLQVSEPTLVVDISETLDLKQQALAAHVSQPGIQQLPKDQAETFVRIELS